MESLRPDDKESRGLGLDLRFCDVLGDQITKHFEGLPEICDEARVRIDFQLPECADPEGLIMLVSYVVQSSVENAGWVVLTLGYGVDKGLVIEAARF